MWRWYSSLKMLLQTGSLTLTWVVDIPGRLRSRSPMKWGNSQSWKVKRNGSFKFSCDVAVWADLNDTLTMTNVGRVLRLIGCCTLGRSLSYQLILGLCGVSSHTGWRSEMVSGCRSYCLFTALWSAAACSETSTRQNTSTGKIKLTFEMYHCPVESLSFFFFLCLSGWLLLDFKKEPVTIQTNIQMLRPVKELHEFTVHQARF